MSTPATGGSTPAGHRARSLCAFSGQDISEELENNPPGLDDDELAIHGVQNYGQFVSQGLKGVLGDERPGVLCRGNAFGNPGQGTATERALERPGGTLVRRSPIESRIAIRPRLGVSSGPADHWSCTVRLASPSTPHSQDVPDFPLGLTHRPCEDL